MLLQSKNLNKKYGRRTVVDDVSIEVRQGEIVGLLGPNGAGRTTTFYMNVGFIPPNEGRVYLNEEDMTRLPMYRRGRRGNGYLPQEPRGFRKLCVEDNIACTLQMMPLAKQKQKEKLESLIDEL